MTEGERVKLVRKKRGLTLEKFGKQIGMGASSISDIENGRRTLTNQTRISICREFNVREEWLRDGDGDIFQVEPMDDLDDLLKGRGIRSDVLPAVKSVVFAFLELEEPSRNAVIQFLQNCAERLNTRATEVAAPDSDLAREIAELKRQNAEEVAKLKRQNRDLAERLEAIEKEDAEREAQETAARNPVPSQFR